LMPWYLKLGLGGAAAFATVRATVSAVSQERAWNVRTLRWLVVLVVLLTMCGLSSYYYHLYGEEPDEEDQSVTSSLWSGTGAPAGVWSLDISMQAAPTAKIAGVT
jgi:hypothetical protein